MAGLAVTGEVNTETIGQMNKPRCGLPDNIRGRDRLPPDAPHPPDNPQAFTTYPGTFIKYSVRCTIAIVGS